MLTGVAVLALCATFLLVLALRGERREKVDPTRPYGHPARPLVPAAPPPRATAAVATMSAREEPEPEAPDLPAAGSQRERERLEVWRREQLDALGLDATLAGRALAAGLAVSEVRSLVERGCPPELAVEILL